MIWIFATIGISLVVGVHTRRMRLPAGIEGTSTCHKPGVFCFKYYTTYTFTYTSLSYPCANYTIYIRAHRIIQLLHKLGLVVFVHPVFSLAFQVLTNIFQLLLLSWLLRWTRMYSFHDFALSSNPQTGLHFQPCGDIKRCPYFIVFRVGLLIWWAEQWKLQVEAELY